VVHKADGSRTVEDPVTPDEMAATVRLGGRAAAALTAHVERVHGGIAQRAFGAVGPIGAPVGVVHDGVARVAYRSVGATLRGAGIAAGSAVRTIAPPGSRPIGASPRANQALAALNAVVGSGLAADDDPLAIRMAVRDRGCDVNTDPAGLADAFPTVTPAVVVFLHGLGENENAWRLRAGDAGVTYGSRLAADLALTPVYVRYNTGRHISDNGAELSRLLTAVVDAWPVDLERLVLVGHSMGGLVARSACRLGTTGNEPWTALISDVVYLGSPHRGATLARSARLLASALSTLPETKAWAAPLDASPGIRDLRHGYVAPEDWADCDDGPCRKNHATDVPLLPTANHYAVSATVVADPRSPAGRVIGDLLVQPASAHGRHREGRHLPFLDRVNVPGRNHFSLLNDAEVYEALHRWLAPKTVAALG
jgi:pimeloyl-ACP methyl ester carboxylesterase